MPKNYTLSESDRRLLSASLREQRSAPPRPAIVKIQGKEFESADSWWALPPCETGLPGGIQHPEGFVIPGMAVCCIYSMDAGGMISAARDDKGAVLRARVFNVYPNTINSLVRVHKDKTGDWSNEPQDITESVITTTSTTPNANTTPAPSLCAGECVWIATTDNQGNVVWRSQPQGGCRDTTTTTTTTTFNPSGTTPVPPNTTPAPCQSEKCKLICLPATTASPGTTVWPPSPLIPYRYQEVINQNYPGCSQPCTCYGLGDPCWLLNGEVESRCLVVNTTTSTTTTTAVPTGNTACDVLRARYGYLPGKDRGFVEDYPGNFPPPIPVDPNVYAAARWQDGRDGGWQVCQACPEGTEPWWNPEFNYFSAVGWQSYDDFFPPSETESRQQLIDASMFGTADIFIAESDVASKPVKEWDMAWTFSVGCRLSPCSVGGPITATEYEAEYRAFTREDIYRYWLSNPCQTFGREFLKYHFHLTEEDGVGPDVLVPGCDYGMTDEQKDNLFRALFGFVMPRLEPLISHRAVWSICKSCPPGTRPLRTPQEWIYQLDENTDGELVEGVWVYKTQCVNGIDCSECDDIPVLGSMGIYNSSAPTTTTTLAPCGCEPPRFCPTVANECTRTRCVPGGSNVPPPCTTKPGTCFDFVYQKECNCATTTTGRPTTTSTTTVPPSCLSDTCEWVVAYDYSTDQNGEPYKAGADRPMLRWQLTRNCGLQQGGSILGTVACKCQNAPPTTCLPRAGGGQYCGKAVGNCGDTFSSPCVAISGTTCNPSRNCPSCSNGCYWGAELVSGFTAPRYEWRRLLRHRDTTPAPPCNDPVSGVLAYPAHYFNPDGSVSCNSVNGVLGSLGARWDFSDPTSSVAGGLGIPANNLSEIPPGCDISCLDLYPNRNFNCGLGGRRYACACQRPPYPPSGCDWMVFTPCEEVRPKECACCSTTTTTENPCSRNCVYKGDGSGGWTQISNPCSGGCPCPQPLGQSHDSCEKIELKCGSRPSTTTTTTTGTGGPTTTTTTTARPQGACCYSGYNPSGCINTWQIECTSAGGTWLGAGTNCSTSSCPVTTTVAPTTSTTTTTAGPTTTTTTTTTTAAPLGRCCYRPNSGSDAFSCRISTESECNNLFGNWAQGATCASLPCLGACCYQTQLSGTVCSDLVTQPNCVSFFSGVWYPGQSCLSLNDCQGGATTTSGPTTSSPTLAP